jgi:hypothetical protein
MQEAIEDKALGCRAGIASSVNATACSSALPLRPFCRVDLRLSFSACVYQT